MVARPRRRTVGRPGNTLLDHTGKAHPQQSACRHQRLVSVTADGTPPEAQESEDPVSDASGRYVAFTSGARIINLVLFDATDGTSKLLSVPPTGLPANGNSWAPRITAEGDAVVFDSGATNLVAGDYNGVTDVFLANVLPETIALVSWSHTGEPADAESFAPAISADGLTVAYAAAATNLTGNPDNGMWDIFVTHVATGITQLVSVAPDGTAADGYSDRPAISGDGSVVTYRSDAIDIVPDTDLVGIARVYAAEIGAP